VRINVFYFHTNIVTKKWGQKNERNNFYRNTRIERAKNVGKKSSVKSAKKRFLYSHEYRDEKIRTKNARNNFSRNTRIVRTKNGKISSEKNEKKTCFVFTRIS